MQVCQLFLVRFVFSAKSHPALCSEPKQTCRRSNRLPASVPHFFKAGNHIGQLRRQVLNSHVSVFLFCPASIHRICHGQLKNTHPQQGSARSSSRRRGQELLGGGYLDAEVGYLSLLVVLFRGGSHPLTTRHDWRRVGNARQDPLRRLFLGHARPRSEVFTKIFPAQLRSGEQARPEDGVYGQRSV